MVNTMFQFSNKRFRCPYCQSERGFAPILSLEQCGYGKCHSCGIFVSPGNPLMNGINTVAPLATPKIPNRTVEESIVSASQNMLEKHPFIKGLLNLGISRNHMVFRGLGVTADNGVLFWMKNINGMIVNAKKFFFDDSFHRSKSYHPYHLYSGGQGYGVCLFGEDLLKSDDQKVVIIVESEKSAVIASFFNPNYLWLACGGASGLTMSKAKVLRSRRVLLCYDADMPGRVNAQNVKQQLEKSSIQCGIVDLFPNRDDGFDIGDFYIEKTNNGISI